MLILGFTGQNCETNINDCLPSPCPLAATCVDQVVFSSKISIEICGGRSIRRKKNGFHMLYDWNVVYFRLTAFSVNVHSIWLEWTAIRQLMKTTNSDSTIHCFQLLQHFLYHSDLLHLLSQFLCGSNSTCRSLRELFLLFIIVGKSVYEQMNFSQFKQQNFSNTFCLIDFPRICEWWSTVCEEFSQKQITNSEKVN